MNGNDKIYFDSFGVGNIPKEIKKFIGNKYRIQAYDSIMCGYCHIGFIDVMLKGKSLKGKSSLDYTNLFSPK